MRGGRSATATLSMSIMRRRRRGPREELRNLDHPPHHPVAAAAEWTAGKTEGTTRPGQGNPSTL